jgi:DNA-binding MarR family transcriptional regulator
MKNNKRKLEISQEYLRYVKNVQNKYEGLSNPGFSVLTYIAANEGIATIAKILVDPLFKGLSMSTIKRAVVELRLKRLIRSMRGLSDKREEKLYLEDREV